MFLATEIQTVLVLGILTSEIANTWRCTDTWLNNTQLRYIPRSKNTNDWNRSKALSGHGVWNERWQSRHIWYPRSIDGCMDRMQSRAPQLQPPLRRELIVERPAASLLVFYPLFSSLQNGLSYACKTLASSRRRADLKGQARQQKLKRLHKYWLTTV